MANRGLHTTILPRRSTKRSLEGLGRTFVGPISLRSCRRCPTRSRRVLGKTSASWITDEHLQPHSGVAWIDAGLCRKKALLRCLGPPQLAARRSRQRRSSRGAAEGSVKPREFRQGVRRAVPGPRRPHEGSAREHFDVFHDQGAADEFRHRRAQCQRRQRSRSWC